MEDYKKALNHSLGAVRRMYTVFNTMTRPILGEQILLLDYKLRCINDIRQLAFDGGDDLDNFEFVRYDEYLQILEHYRSRSKWGKLKVLWIQLSK